MMLYRTNQSETSCSVCLWSAANPMHPAGTLATESYRLLLIASGGIVMGLLLSMMTACSHAQMHAADA